MFRNRLFASVAVALVVLMAGCSDVAPAPDKQSTRTRSPARTAEPTATVDGQPTPTESPASHGRASTATEPARPRNYTRLYDRTIGSVVESTVRTPQGQSQGSGFVYRADGYIVTNRHVIGAADRVQVRFRTGAWRTGRVVGTDIYADLAVVRVDSLPAGVDPLPIASDDPEPGQPFAALGSPLGYEGSITTGIVSGVNRSMQTARSYSIPDTIQTDAPINPGNSGGPLVSLNGTVQGVNRAKQGDNLGFAISADVIRRVVPALIENGSYHHAYLGVRTTQVTPRIARANGLTEARGVMGVTVADDGPAGSVLGAAALERTDTGRVLPVGGDIIVSVDGQRIRSQQTLAQYLLLHTRPGEQVRVTVLRDGRRVTETVTLGRRPELKATV